MERHPVVWLSYTIICVFASMRIYTGTSRYPCVHIQTSERSRSERFISRSLSVYLWMYLRVRACVSIYLAEYSDACVCVGYEVVLEGTNKRKERKRKKRKNMRYRRSRSSSFFYLSLFLLILLAVRFRV